MNNLNKVLRIVTEKMAYGAMAAILACVGLVMSDIVKRSLGFGFVRGVAEIVPLISAVILSMGIAYLTYLRGHVAVGMLVDRLAPRKQAMVDLVTYVISIAVTVALTWAMFKYASYVEGIGWHSGSMKIPLYPFVYVVAVSLALTCVVLIKEVVNAVVIVVRKGGGT
ncbi:MAG: TRAP transporter small permease [Dehalococcoidia bacterium]